MRSLFLLLLFFSGISTLQAHQADVSTTMLVERESGQWVLQVSASLSAFQYEVETNFPEEVYTSPEGFQRLVERLMLDNLRIEFNGGTPARLEAVSVKLGHETQALFTVNNVPEKMEEVLVHNGAFRDIHRNQSALLLLKQGYENKQFILNEDNDHTVSLELGESVYQLTKPKEASMALVGLSLISVVGLATALTFGGLRFLFANMTV